MLEFKTVLINGKNQRIYNKIRNVLGWMFLLMAPFTFGSKGVDTGFSYLMPDYYFFITFVLLLFIITVLINYLIFKKGVIIFTPEKIKVRFKNNSLTIVYKVSQIDNVRLQYKPSIQKDSQAVFEVGIENWIYFTYRNKEYSYQFQIKTKEEEKLFLKIYSSWKKDDVQ